MPGSPTIKGDNTVQFGSSGVYASGIIVSGSKKNGSESITVQDNNGYTVAQITIAGVANCLVQDSEQMWNQKEVRKFRVRAKKWSGMTLA